MSRTAAPAPGAALVFLAGVVALVGGAALAGAGWWLVPVLLVGTVYVATCLLYRDAAILWCVAYITIVTQDPSVLPVSPKIPLLLAALTFWVVQRQSLPDRRLARLVLVAAIAVPALWGALALARAFGVAPSPFAIQQAGRFSYLLLFFPLAGMLRRMPWASWLAPVLVLAAATLAIWLSATLGVIDVGASGAYLIFEGVIGQTPAGLRLFFGNHILFIPAAAALVALLFRGGRQRITTAAGLLLVAAIVASRTRGIYLGAGTAVATVVLAELSTRLRLSRNAVLVGGAALGVVAVAVAVVFAHYVLASSDPSLGTRREQLPQLSAAILRQPVLGWGLGATLPSGYFRSATAPWSFELTYLQVLFEFGVIGVLALFAPAAAAFARLLVRLRSRAVAEDEGRHVRTAALGALAGLALAFGTNPYLFSSYGMLSLALTLALADVGLAGRSGVRHDPRWDRVSIRQLRSSRERVWRPALPTVAVLALAVVVAATAYRAEGDAPTSSRPAAATVDANFPLVLRGSITDPSTFLVADGDAADLSPSLYAIGAGPRPGFATVTKVNCSTGRVRRLSTLRIPASALRAVPDVAVWAGDRALFAFTPSTTGIDVRVTSLRRGRTIARGRAPAPLPPGGGALRDVSVATWSGPLPDLFVVVRRARSRPVVEIFSGESRFRRRIGRMALPSGPVCEACGDIDVSATLRGHRPDVFIYVRNGGAASGGLPTVRVASGASGYRRVLSVVNLHLNVRNRPVSVMGGRSGPLPVVTLVDQRLKTVRSFPAVAR